MLNELNEVNELTAVLRKVSFLPLHLPVENEEDLCWLDRWRSEALPAEGLCWNLFATKSSGFMRRCCQPLLLSCSCHQRVFPYILRGHRALQTWFSAQASAWGLRSVQDYILQTVSITERSFWCFPSFSEWLIVKSFSLFFHCSFCF